jgi:hypothetical protein
MNCRELPEASLGDLVDAKKNDDANPIIKEGLSGYFDFKRRRDPGLPKNAENSDGVGRGDKRTE